MKQIIFILLSAFILSGCNQKGKASGDSGEDSKLTFLTKDYKLSSTIGKGDETTVTASIVTAEGESEAAKKINNKVFDTVKLIVGQEGDASTGYDVLFTGFITTYEGFVNENPDYPGAWEADITSTVEYNTPEILNIKIESYTMTGGAHGNPNTTSLLFDSKNGKGLTMTDIVNDTIAISEIAEKKFREKNNITTDKSLNSAGYMFSGDKFVLPQNIFVTKEGLVLFYNVYEIAAYVNGTTELLLPYDEIKNYLSVKLQ